MCPRPSLPVSNKGNIPTVTHFTKPNNSFDDASQNTMWYILFQRHQCCRPLLQRPLDVISNHLANLLLVLLVFVGPLGAKTLLGISQEPDRVFAIGNNGSVAVAISKKLHVATEVRVGEAAVEANNRATLHGKADELALNRLIVDVVGCLDSVSALR